MKGLSYQSVPDFDDHEWQHYKVRGLPSWFSRYRATRLQCQATAAKRYGGLMSSE